MSGVCQLEHLQVCSESAAEHLTDTRSRKILEEVALVTFGECSALPIELTMDWQKELEEPLRAQLVSAFPL